MPSPRTRRKFHKKTLSIGGCWTLQADDLGGKDGGDEKDYVHDGGFVLHKEIEGGCKQKPCDHIRLTMMFLVHF